MPDRRRFLQTLSSIPLIGSYFNISASTVSASNKGRNYFEELGVKTFINAAGTYTALTASLMRPEVMEAMNYASHYFVSLNELHEVAGKRIAQLVQSEGALVTSGAASALSLGTAACLTGKNPELIRRLPDLTGMKSEVIIQKTHRFGYDHAVRNCGVKMIEVDTLEALENAIGEKTAMMLFFNDAEPRGQVKAEQFAALGKKRSVPTMIDCAADVPPTENLWKYTKMGFDLVAFSGGKGIRGPQSAGLLLGRQNLIEAARLNASPNGDTIGRGMKVNKEEILGMMVALEVYLKRDDKAEWKEWERQAKVVMDSVNKVKSVTTEMYVPPIANHVPTVRIKWEKAALKLTADEVRKELRSGSPAIEIVPASSPAAAEIQEISVGVWQLQSGEVEVVAKRLRDIIKSS